MEQDSTTLGRIIKVLHHVPGVMLGTLFTLIERLGGKDGHDWFTKLKKLLRGEVYFIGNIFRRLHRVGFQEFREPFDVKEGFSKETLLGFGADVREPNDTFKTHFFEMVEPTIVGGSGIIVSEIRSSAETRKILFELGGRGKAETKLQEVWYLLKHCHLPDQNFLSGTFANVFFVRDFWDDTRLVVVQKLGNGRWEILSYPGETQFEQSFPRGTRVFSPDTDEAPLGVSGPQE